MFFFSKIGKGGFIFWLIVIGFAIYYIIKKDYKKAILTCSYFVALGVTFVLVDFIIKPLVKESRPLVQYEEIIGYMINHDYKVPDDYSFPSGHSAAAFLAVSYLMFISRKSLFVTLPLAILISFSRVFIGAHYLGDVLAGGAIGLALGVGLYFVAKVILDKLFKLRENNHAS